MVNTLNFILKQGTPQEDLDPLLKIRFNINSFIYVHQINLFLKTDEYVIIFPHILFYF
jgi:hypothetical protein